MRNKLILAALIVATTAGPMALAQERPQPGGIPTETQRRIAQGEPDFPWDAIGLFGLLGLLGLRRRHPEDSYHPAPLP